MEGWEYFDAQNKLEALYDKVRKLSPHGRDLSNALKEYFEALITIRGHAWCMDVRVERRKMARLVVGAYMNILTPEDKADKLDPNEISIRCSCKKNVVLRLLGGQYPDSYAGRCACQKGWVLTDLPAKLPFS